MWPFIISYVTLAIGVTVCGLFLKEEIQPYVKLRERHPDDLKAPALMILLGWAWPVLFLMLIGAVILGFIDTVRESYHIVRSK